jgi:hypothetical protein
MFKVFFNLREKYRIGPNAPNRSREFKVHPNAIKNFLTCISYGRVFKAELYKKLAQRIENFLEEGEKREILLKGIGLRKPFDNFRTRPLEERIELSLAEEDQFNSSNLFFVQIQLFSICVYRGFRI